MAEAKEKDAWWQDMGQGVGASGLKTVYGIQEIFKELSPEQQHKLDALVADAAESGWGTVGTILGEAVQMAIPGGAAAKALKVAGKAKKLSSKARMGMDAGSAGLFGAAQAPGEGETRFGNAGAEIAASLAGSTIGEIAGKVFPNPMRGIKRTPESEVYKETVGEYPTPGTASSGNVVPRLEELAAMASPGFREARGNATQKLKDVAQNQSAMYPHFVTKTGNEGFEQIGDQFDAAWERIWDDSPMDIKASGDIVSKLGLAMRRMPQSSKDYIDKYFEDITEIVPNDMLHTWRTMRETLDNSIELTKLAPPRVREAFADARKQLDDSLPNHKKRELERYHGKKAEFETVQDARAAAVATPAAEGPSFGRLLQAGGTEGGKRKAATGKTALYDIGQLGLDTVDRETFAMTNQLARKLNPVLPDVVSQPNLERGGRLMLGQNPIQKAGTAFSDSLLGEGMGVFKPRTGNIAAALVSNEREKSAIERERERQRRKREEEQALSSDGWEEF